jgi:hypothetical protein
MKWYEKKMEKNKKNKGEEKGRKAKKQREERYFPLGRIRVSSIVLH